MTDVSVDPRLFGTAAERRAFRDELGRGIGRYIPPELRPLLGFVAEATPSAAVERAGAASMRAVGPDRTVLERVGDVGEVLSETAGVVAPAVVAGRAGMPVAEAVQEAFMGASVPARAAAETVFERLNQPGPMPERLLSGVDPLAAFRAAREAMLGASREMSLEDLSSLSARQAAARDAAVAALSDAPSVRLFDRSNRAAVVGPGMGPGEEGRFRVTYFDADRRPTNHTVYETREEALNAALREGFDSRSAAREPDAVSRQLEELGYDPFLPGFQPESPSDALGFTEDVYHYTQGPADFDEFRLTSRTRGGLPQDWLGVHVGTPQSAEDRFLDYREFPSVEGAQEAVSRPGPVEGFGSTMPLRARADRPFLNPETNEPFTETELRRFLDESVIRGSRNPQSAILAFRRELAERGFTDVPYVNEVEDVGSISRVMLTDRPEGSPAVLRSRFARFDPRFVNSRNLMAGVGGAGVMVGALSGEDEEEPAVRGYADGGAIYGGVGSLNGVARGMFRG